MDDQICLLSVKELFGDGSYNIPLYQRNYAWGEAEIEQLLRDVADMCEKKDQSNYYIGTLIVWRRQGVSANFETIDGQQRHTTLALLLAVLKNERGINLEGIGGSTLHFDGRPLSEVTLHRLFEHGQRHENEETALRTGYEIIKRWLGREKGICPQAFTNYLLSGVKLLRVVVPEGTDLNHYFEIMNNRGEQLEKHEILKAWFLAALETPQERTAFSQIWEACAEMNRYVQLGFDTDRRQRIFGNEWNTCPETPEELFRVWDDGTEQIQTGESLGELIARKRFHDGERNTSEDKETGSFGSIVSFPNFLLHVLRLYSADRVPLDDKQLLEAFQSRGLSSSKGTLLGNMQSSRTVETGKIDPRAFAHVLLKCRLMFDRYIIKRDSNDDWALQSLVPYRTGFGYVNTFGDGEAHANQRLIMLLSMFHVSFPAQTYKHWLQATLRHLFRPGGISATGYVEFLESLSDRIFYGRFGTTAHDYEDLIDGEALPSTGFDPASLHQGTQVQNFVFNRLDYLLWKAIPEGDFRGLDMGYVRNRHRHFKFTFRSSVEHYYPQQPVTGEKLEASDNLPDGVDNFANLCLISHSRNSKLSNHLPEAKKEYYQKAASGEGFVESLKQMFMMSYQGWGPQHIENMKHHGEMMLRVLLGERP